MIGASFRSGSLSLLCGGTGGYPGVGGSNHAAPRSCPWAARRTEVMVEIGQVEG